MSPNIKKSQAEQESSEHINALQSLQNQSVNFFRVLLAAAPEDNTGDEIVAYYRFMLAHGRAPTNEVLFNDVLYQTKVSDYLFDPLVVFTSDKDLAKIYIANKVGKEFLVPTIATLDSDDGIESFVFPHKCVIKPTHSCEKVIFVSSYGNVNVDNLKSWLRHNYYHDTREKNYKHLKPKIIVEPLLFGGRPVDDYKVFCFDGRAKCILFANDRHKGNFFRLLFDTEWNILPVKLYPYGRHRVPDKPRNLRLIIELAEKLSKPFKFVRVDFYVNADIVLVGEITHCHQSANEKFVAEEEHRILSDAIFG